MKYELKIVEIYEVKMPKWFFDEDKGKPVMIEVPKKVRIIEDDHGGKISYCAAFLEKGIGGPIVSADTIEEIKKKFNEMLNVTSSINNLMRFVKMEEDGKLKKDEDKS